MGSKDNLLSVEQDQVKKWLNKVDMHKSKGPAGMYPWMLRELADVIAWTLSIIFERS